MRTKIYITGSGQLDPPHACRGRVLMTAVLDAHTHRNARCNITRGLFDARYCRPRNLCGRCATCPRLCSIIVGTRNTCYINVNKQEKRKAKKNEVFVDLPFAVLFFLFFLLLSQDLILYFYAHTFLKSEGPVPVCTDSFVHPCDSQPH